MIRLIKEEEGYLYYVDDQNVEFIGDYALVQAVMVSTTRRNITIPEEHLNSIYKVYVHIKENLVFGIINKEYKEAFSDLYKAGKSTNSAHEYLMFYRFNREIIRIGEKDFIVTVSYYDDDRNWLEIKHLRIVKKTIRLINDKLPELKPTNIKTILKSRYFLYDVKAAKAIGPKYSLIEDFKKYNSSKGEIIMAAKVVDNITSLKMNGIYIPKNKDTALSTELHFYINEEGKIVSNIYSTFDQEKYGWQTHKEYKLLRREILEKLKSLEAINISNIKKL